MITQMKKYTFLVFYKDYADFLTKLREAGVLHIADKGSVDPSDETILEQTALAGQIEKTIKVAESFMPEVDSSTIAVDESANIDLEAAKHLIRDFDSLIAEKKQLEQELADTLREKERMAIWGYFSSDIIKRLDSEGYTLRYFSCSKKSFKQEWEDLGVAFPVAEQGSTLYFVTIGSANEQIVETADEIHLNEQNYLILQTEAEALNEKISLKQQELQDWSKQNISSLRGAEVAARRQIDWTKVNLSTSTLADNKLCVLEGFCPIDNTSALNTMLDEQHIYFTEADPKEEDNTPIKLRNNRFTKMFECLTGMYGWPVYGEFDPTPILGPFFLLFFALCMGDAGYGIILILFGILTTKKIINIQMFEGLGPLITTLGVGTLVIGFFLGTFFGIDLYNASWVPESLKSVMIKGEVMGYDIQMVMALCIGVFHICLAMTIKAICYTQRFGFKQNIATWGWLLLILGGLITAILTLTKVFSADVTKWVLIIVGSISALAIYIFNTPGRNPLINIGAGLWDTYNMATGILGDVLSYIRLYALGLAGGMLGGAFNTLGIMVLGETPNIGTWIGFIAILIVGHLLNICMSALGAFVHPLRLSFVEYFKNSGYEGKGTLYQPFQLYINK